MATLSTEIAEGACFEDNNTPVQPPAQVAARVLHPA